MKFMLLLLLEIQPFVYKTVSSVSGGGILRNQFLKFPVPIVLDMAGCRKCRFFHEKMFQNQSEITLR